MHIQFQNRARVFPFETLHEIDVLVYTRLAMKRVRKTYTLVKNMVRFISTTDSTMLYERVGSVHVFTGFVTRALSVPRKR